MKPINVFLASSVFLFLFASQLNAQRQGWNRSPEERATLQSNLMRDSLGLSDAQYEKVKEINLEYANKAEQLRQDAEGDWGTMREQMTSLRQQQNEALRAVLTTEQYEKWLKLQEAMRQRWNNPRQGEGHR